MISLSVSSRVTARVPRWRRNDNAFRSWYLQLRLAVPGDNALHDDADHMFQLLRRSEVANISLFASIYRYKRVFVFNFLKVRWVSYIRRVTCVGDGSLCILILSCDIWLAVLLGHGVIVRLLLGYEAYGWQHYGSFLQSYLEFSFCRFSL